MLHNTFVEFILSRDVWHEPIREAFTPELSEDDPRLLQRICNGNGPQHLHGKPYLVFDGPHGWNPHLTSDGAVNLKTAIYWITVYHADIDDCLTWLTNIENDVISLFTPGYFFTTSSGRISNMLQMVDSKAVVRNDQVLQSSEQFPYNAATIAFTVSWYDS